MKSSGRRWTPLAVAALVLGFMVWWPLGLAVLAYILWGGDVDTTVKHTVDKFRTPSSGNAAFDDYKKETLDRLEKEQEAFAEFVEHLRRTRDREEFERFMAERSKPAQPEAA
ncbi:MAG: DUF2852 domain-containing protein [Rhizobiales bacterium]|nr:DUF2852 domain-containing protein [Hyphomicrobiales bacterium]